MKNAIIFGGSVIAIYLVSKREGQILGSENKDFRNGFIAGFITPSPILILSFAGIVSFW